MRFGDEDIHKYEGPALQRELLKYGVDLFVAAPKSGEDITKVVTQNLEECRAFIAFGTRTYAEDTGNTACTYNELSYWLNTLQRNDPARKFIPLRMLRDGENFDTSLEGVSLAAMQFGKNISYTEWQLGSTREYDEVNGEEVVGCTVPEKVVRQIVRTINPEALLKKEYRKLTRMEPELLAEEISKLRDANQKLEAEQARDRSAMTKLGLGELMKESAGEGAAGGAPSATIRAVCLGAINLDIAASTEMEWPTHDESGVGEMRQSGGGKGANESVALARLGVTPAFVGCIGQDTFGELLRLTLSKSGVDTSGVRAARQAGAQTGSAVQIIAKGPVKGPVKFGVMCPNANALVGETEVQTVKELLLTPDVDVLLLQNEVSFGPMLKVIELAKNPQKGEKLQGAVSRAASPHAASTMTISEASPASSQMLQASVVEPKAVAFKASPLRKDGVAHAQQLIAAGVDILFLNEWETPTLLGRPGKLVTLEHAEQAADELLGKWPSLKAVVLTCGVAHLVKQRAGQPWLDGFPAGESDTLAVVGRSKLKIVDVIGAADAFTGAFIATAIGTGGRKRGSARASPFACLLRAHLAGDFSTQKAGAQDSLPTEEELAAYTEEHCPRWAAMQRGWAAGAHVGVKCDRSGCSPIVGNRYSIRSNGHEFNLCEQEFKKVVDTSEQLLYERIPPPPPLPTDGSAVQTALHMGVLRGNHAAFRSVLMQAGSRSELRRLVGVQDVFGLTPSQRAYQCRLLERSAEEFVLILRDVLLAQLFLSPEQILKELENKRDVHEINALADSSIFPHLELPMLHESRHLKQKKDTEVRTGRGSEQTNSRTVCMRQWLVAGGGSAAKELAALVRKDALVKADKDKKPEDAKFVRLLVGGAVDGVELEEDARPMSEL
jgi:sugar/nucleoside kinase (ribokinase family)